MLNGLSGDGSQFDSLSALGLVFWIQISTEDDMKSHAGDSLFVKPHDLVSFPQF
jgi:hypothetical protein